MTGRTPVISVQTRAEVLAGLRIRDLGSRRQAQINGQLDATETLPIDSSLADVCADLSAACVRAGHALQAKDHTADRWIAATAIRWNLPLLSGDGIYRSAPGLRLLDDEVTEA